MSSLPLLRRPAEQKLKTAQYRRLATLAPGVKVVGQSLP